MWGCMIKEENGYTFIQKTACAKHKGSLHIHHISNRLRFEKRSITQGWAHEVIKYERSNK